MKKLLLTAIATLAIATTASAKEVVEVLTIDNFGFTQMTSYKDVEYTSEETGIKYEGNMCKANNNDGNGMQFRVKGEDEKGKASGLAITENTKGLIIKSIKVEPSTSASTTNQWDIYGSPAVYSSSTALYDKSTQGTLIGSGTTEATVTPETNDLTAFGFRSNKKAIYIQKITITYEMEEAKPEPKPAELSFPEESYEAIVGQEFGFPDIVNPNEIPSTEIKWTSSDENVATVCDFDGWYPGAVEVVGPGTTTITATFAGNDEYEAQTVSYTLTTYEVKPEYTAPDVVNFEAEEVPYMRGMMALQFTGTTTGEEFTVNVAYGEKPFDSLIWMTPVAQEKENTGEGEVFVARRAGIDTSDDNVWLSSEVLEEEGFDQTGFTLTIPAISDDTVESYVTVTIPGIGDRFDTEMQVPIISKVTRDTPDGVEAIEAAQGEAKFFNLQGVRVNNPENGVFVKVVNGKAVKVVK